MNHKGPRSRIFPPLFLLVPLLALQSVSAAEQAYPKTPAGEQEIKTLPAATLIMAGSDEAYFSENSQLFGPLFRYIQENGIPMTTPVEAEMDPGRMFFYIGEDEAKEELAGTEEVTVRELPARTVASRGVRGGYSASNFEEARARLEQWLAKQEGWQADGEARAAFWDGPFTPWFLKRFEVHIPVRPQTD
mgnify:FL=1